MIETTRRLRMTRSYSYWLLDNMLLQKSSRLRSHIVILVDTEQSVWIQTIDGGCMQRGCKMAQHFMVVNIRPKHTCASTSRMSGKEATVDWIANRGKDILSREPTIGAREMQRRLEGQFSIDLDYNRVWAGKRAAMEDLHGSWEDSFKLLWNFKAVLEKNCPRSVVQIDCKKVGGQIATRVFRHLMMNFRKKFKGDVLMYMWPSAWTCRPSAWTCKPERYEKLLAKIEETCPPVVAFLQTHHKHLWSRAKFAKICKVDYVNNNISECFSNWIKDLKDLPVVDLMDRIRQKIQKKIATRQ